MPAAGTLDGNTSMHDWSADKTVLHGGDDAHGKSPTADSEACVICMEAAVQVLFKPCMHAIVCQACSALCAARTNECPMCRCHVQQQELLR